MIGGAAGDEIRALLRTRLATRGSEWPTRSVVGAAGMHAAWMLGLGDSALEARILSLETKKSYAHEKEMFTAAAPLISITLSKEAAEKSLVVFVGRLALHAGEDYLVSVVGGKTVLTWHGDFAVGGVEAIAVGDQIRVMYNYLV